MLKPIPLPASFYRRPGARMAPILRKPSKAKREIYRIRLWEKRKMQTGKRVYWETAGRKMAEEVRQAMRYFHIRTTLDSGWHHFRQQGYFQGEVAVIVDGSTTRRIENVHVFGNIIIQEPPSLSLQFEAALYVLNELERRAVWMRDSGDYMRNFVILVDNHWRLTREQLESPETIAALNLADRDPFITIINTMPYAAKLERGNLPGGIFYGVWKRTRAKYGAELALRFRYFTNDSIPIAMFQETSAWYKRRVASTGRGSRTRSDDPRERQRGEAGRLLSFPAIQIGQPGSFNSGASKVIIKAARKA